MTDLAGKTVLITGGAMGMGRLVAEKVAASGAKTLVLWDLKADALAKAKEEIGGLGAQVLTFALDITDREKVYATAKEVKDQAGVVDVLLNNAGIIKGGLFLDVSDEDHRRTVEVNLLSYFWVTRAFLQDMLDRNEGHVINMATAAGITGVPGAASYSASKFAVAGWTESMRLEMKKLGKKGVKFSVVCPSFVNTGMFEGVTAPFLAPIMTPEEMASKIFGAIKSNKKVVMQPFIVKFIPFMKGLNMPFFTDWFGGVLGLHDSMDTWKGRK